MSRVITSLSTFVLFASVLTACEPAPSEDWLDEDWAELEEQAARNGDGVSRVGYADDDGSYTMESDDGCPTAKTKGPVSITMVTGYSDEDQCYDDLDSVNCVSDDEITQQMVSWHSDCTSYCATVGYKCGPILTNEQTGFPVCEFDGSGWNPAWDATCRNVTATCACVH